MANGFDAAAWATRLASRPAAEAGSEVNQLLVSSEWHMRRVLLTVRATFPPSVRVVCCPTPDGCTREHWAGSPARRAVGLRELAVLQAFRSAGLL
jgi:hypothetical protein